MVDLCADTYKSALSPCNIGRFLARMVQASTGKGSFTVKDNPETDGAGDQEVQVDVHMAEIAIANALSNAAAHGDSNETTELSSRFLKGALQQSSTFCCGVVEYFVYHTLPCTPCLFRSRRTAICGFQGGKLHS